MRFDGQHQSLLSDFRAGARCYAHHQWDTGAINVSVKQPTPTQLPQGNRKIDCSSRFPTPPLPDATQTMLNLGKFFTNIL